MEGEGVPVRHQLQSHHQPHRDIFRHRWGLRAHSVLVPSDLELDGARSQVGNELTQGSKKRGEGTAAW